MRKPSCASFMRATVVGSRALAWPLLLMAAVGSAGVAGAPFAASRAWAASAVAAPGADAARELDQAFLTLPAHDLQLATQADRKLTVGDRIELKLSVPPGSVLSDAGELKYEVPPGIESLHEQGWEILAQSREGLTVVAIKSGRLMLPSLVIRDAAGKDLARTNPVPIEILSVIPKDDPKAKEPAPLRPPVGLPFPWWVLLAGALLLLALVTGVVLALKRWSDRKRAEMPKPVLPPKPIDEQALEALAALEKQGLMKNGKYKLHYFTVSDILKLYLGGRYQFDAQESTAYEIVQHLEQNKIATDLVIDRIEMLFERLDRVKFTDHVPAEADGGEVLADVRKLVFETRVVAAPSVMVSAAPTVRAGGKPDAV